MDKSIKRGSSAQAGQGGMGSQVSSEFAALRGMYIALIYELNEQPDFPRKGLIAGLGRMAELLEASGDSRAAALVGETKIVLSVQLGDDD
ncbi:MAG: hypothetical protein HY849_06445 [Nitrosomonadales bacterium]|nr:hypothetical protein [Nitrosomonadales bacterium]